MKCDFGSINVVFVVFTASKEQKLWSKFPGYDR